MTMAQVEREELASFLSTLTPDDWEQPSLCDGWRVRDVAAHIVSYDTLDAQSLATRLRRGHFTLDGSNAAGVDASQGLTPPEILETFSRSTRPRGLTAAFGGRVALLDTMIHQQDIRRALACPRTIPTDRLRAALSFSRIALALGQPWRTRGLSLITTDLDWRSGFGKEVRGPAEPLLMTIAGRRGCARELTGVGVGVLRRRIGD
ncbi:maleylpyruvate isomerase family mycothiol-dependent enzyme [Gordonia neofelifaecis]|uniref:Mycothiol-dependent maleylpyruvate isomerase metal-binding domain-containing protein n=1 Tax=Gordonia neofelifaecis NRRL B-59395 TaxID=644548 RepID=F1YHV3_9ACTN|nr:maleylpyruvate isomerase family mycothiol-dependent enzyme [Gordonia neofelifaecis]EGD55507.1 hypothetical protein SCNU_07338 [Gordonia neofelifaecis NRRL B-59395]